MSSWTSLEFKDDALQKTVFREQNKKLLTGENIYKLHIQNRTGIQNIQRMQTEQ